MAGRKPQLFEDLDVYGRIRLMRASTLVFKNHGRHEYQVGHAKLFGVLLWYYERKKQTRLKYSKVLKKLGYQRSHNYRLLKSMVEKNLLQKEGNGYYSFAPSEIRLIKRVLYSIKEQDMLGNETEVERQSLIIASSERTTRRTVKGKNVH